MCGSVALLWGPSNTLVPKIVQLGTRAAPIGSQPADMVTSDPLQEGPWAKQGVCARNAGRNCIRRWQIPIFSLESWLKSFPAVCDTPILLNKGMSYTIGKLVNSAFQCLEVCKGVTAYLLTTSLVQATDTPCLAGQQAHISIYKVRSLQFES